MSGVWIASALFLLLTVAAGMVRVLIGPRPGDRMLAAQLFGTAGVAMLLLLAWGLEMPALVDVALVFALLSVVATAAFVRQRGLPRGGRESP